MTFPTGIARAAVCVLVLCIPAATQESGPRGAWDRVLESFWLKRPPGPEGNRAYRAGDYPRALAEYGRAHDAKPDPRLAFNAGSALYRQGLYPEATAAWRFALQGAGDDSAFAARGHYNLGNAFARKAGQAATPDEAMSDLREALAHYRKSLMLRPGNREAQRNLELVHNALQQLQQEQEQSPPDGEPPPEQPKPSEEARESLARAMQLVQDRRYSEARAVLDDILRRDPTAAPYEAHLRRIDDVTRIIAGEGPAAPFPRDPRARPGSPGGRP